MLKIATIHCRNGVLLTVLAALSMGVLSPYSAAQAAPQELQVGVAEVVITPPTGFPMAGYYHERLAEGEVAPFRLILRIP